MQREIKFKAISKLNGEWVYGYVVGREHISMGGSTLTLVDPETVGQFTGLHDFWEGDILNDGRDNYVVEKQGACFMLKHIKRSVYFYFYEFSEDSLEHVGNIHENPELLKAR
jgi:hypothetical protein